MCSRVNTASALLWRVAALAVCLVTLSGCAKTKMVVTRPDGTKIKWRSDGTFNNAAAMPLKDFPDPPEIAGAPGAGVLEPARFAAASRAAPGHTVSLGSDQYGNPIGFSFNTLQHSDVEQARWQGIVALSDRALVGYGGYLVNDAYKAAKAADVSTAESSNKLKGLQSKLEADTAQATLKAESKIRAAEIGAGRP